MLGQDPKRVRAGVLVQRDRKPRGHPFGRNLGSLLGIGVFAYTSRVLRKRQFAQLENAETCTFEHEKKYTRPPIDQA